MIIQYLPGKTPANPSAFSMSSSTGMEAIASSLHWPRREEEGYMLVPIPSLRPVSMPIASWSPVIILTLTPRSRALRIVSALSCLGGSKRGNRPTNSQGPPAPSFVFSGIVCGKDNKLVRKMEHIFIRNHTSILALGSCTCLATPKDRRPRSA